jgi:hypothetical protein
MSANNVGPANNAFWYDAANGTPVALTSANGYKGMTFNGFEVENLTEQSDPFGVAAEEHTPTGKYRVSEIELSGLYDSKANTGPVALFGNRYGEGPGANTRTFTMQLGAANTSVETHLKSFKREASTGELSKFTVVLIPTGTVTEA